MDLEHSRLNTEILLYPPALCSVWGAQGKRGQARAGPPHLDGPNGRVPKLDHALCVILQLVYALLLGQQFMLLEVLEMIEAGTAMSKKMALDTSTAQACPHRPHTLASRQRGQA